MNPTKRPTIVVTANASRNSGASMVTLAAPGRPSGPNRINRRVNATAMNSPARAAQTASSIDLGQQLTNQAPAAGAERGSHRKLGPPLGVAPQQQVDNVDAGDEQQEPDRGEHRQHGRPRFPGEIAVQRLHQQAARQRCPGRAREARHRIAPDLRELRRRILARNALSKPGDHAEVMSPFTALERWQRLVVLH